MRRRLHGLDLHGLEQACWAIALASAAWIACAYGQAHAAARQLPAVAHAAERTTPAGAVLGELRIPKIGLAVPVIEDDDTRSLLRGVGHIPGTAMPGGLGTVGLAGHRDTFLRPLANIAPRMEIEVSRGSAMYRYIVDSTEIVHPEAVGVLDEGNKPELVLVTCYPFHYIGAAPLRFIVHAHLLSLTPERLVPESTIQ